MTATGFYLHGQTNSGGILFTGSVVYSSGSLPSNDTEKALFAANLANVYSGTNLSNSSNIQPFISAIGNSGTLASLGGGLLKASLGGSVSTVETPPVATFPATCHNGTFITSAQAQANKSTIVANISNYL